MPGRAPWRQRDGDSARIRAERHKEANAEMMPVIARDAQKGWEFDDLVWEKPAAVLAEVGSDWVELPELGD